MQPNQGNVAWRHAVYINRSGTVNIESYAGDGVSGLYLWGPQAEFGYLTGTAYVPTSGVAITASSFIVQGGTVGIGVQTPGAVLHIADALSATYTNPSPQSGAVVLINQQQGTMEAGVFITRQFNATRPPTLQFGGNYGGGALFPAANYDLGNIVFSGLSGAVYMPAAYIKATTPISWSTGTAWGQLQFGTANSASVATEKMMLDSTGNLRLRTGQIQGYLAAAPITLMNTASDGASSVGTVLDGFRLFSTVGSKLLSIRNSGSEQASVDKDGYIVSSGSSVGRFVAVPASASASGRVGDFSADTSFVYVCISTNAWVRASASTW